MRLGLLRLAAALAVLAALAMPARADWQPTENIKLITHASPGTSIELMLREIASIWDKHKIVPVMVNIENRTGARGDRARRFVVEQSAGNPHVLFGLTPSQVVNAVLMGGEINAKRYTPIAVLATETQLIVVNADSPYKSAEDLLEAARKKPGAILQGGGSFGVMASFTNILMNRATKVDITYTPFKADGEAVVALLGKHVDFMMANLAEINEHVKAGKLRIIAASAPLADYPEVKTFEQQGLKFRNLEQYRGILAPPGIPPEAQAYWIDVMKRTVATPEWKDYERKNILAERWVAGPDLLNLMVEDEATLGELSKQLGLVK